MNNEEETDQAYDRMEEIINWTLPGLAMYYRDCHLDQEAIEKYTEGKILRSPTFVDVSSLAGKPASNCRFIIASSKAAPLYRLNPAIEKWRLHTLNCNSYFKVLDVFTFEGITQIFLLHIPYIGISFFDRAILELGGQNIEEQIIAKARESLRQKIQSDIIPVFQEKEWIGRTALPIGLDGKNEFFSLEVTEPLPAQVKPIYSVIKKMTNDISDVNEVPA